jgi:hypothetical protein
MQMFSEIAHKMVFTALGARAEREKIFLFIPSWLLAEMVCSALLDKHKARFFSLGVKCHW